MASKVLIQLNRLLHLGVLVVLFHSHGFYAQECNKKVTTVRRYCLNYKTSTRVVLPTSNVLSCSISTDRIRILKAQLIQINIASGSLCPVVLPPDRPICPRLNVTSELESFCTDDKCIGASFSMDRVGGSHCPGWLGQPPIYLEAEYECVRSERNEVTACSAESKAGALFISSISLRYDSSTPYRCNCGVTLPPSSDIALTYVNLTYTPAACDTSGTLQLAGQSWGIASAKHTGMLVEACRFSTSLLKMDYVRPVGVSYCDYFIAISAPAGERLSIICEEPVPSSIAPQPSILPTVTPPTTTTTRRPTLPASRMDGTTTTTPSPATTAQAKAASATDYLSHITDETWVIIGIIAATFLIIAILVIVAACTSTSKREKDSATAQGNYNTNFDDLQSINSRGTNATMKSNEDTYYNFDMDTQRPKGDFAY